MKERFRLTFMKKLMMVALVPCIIVSVFMCGGTLTSLKNNMTMEIEETLRATAYSLSFDDTQEELNGYKETLGIDVTVFDDNVRMTTTVPDSVGTKADEKIYNEVKSGKEFFSTDANVNGQRYFGYYIPTYDEGGEFIGMTFAGKPTENANAVIIKAISLMLSSTGAVLIGVIIMIFFTARYMTKLMKNSTELISEVSKGNFNVKADKKVSSDEIGEIYKQAGELASSLKDTIAHIKGIAGKLNDMSISMSGSMGTITENTGEINKAVEEIASGAMAQADSVQDATTSMINVNDMVLAVQMQVVELTTVAEVMQSIEKDVVSYIGTLSSLNATTNAELKKVNELVARTSTDIKAIQKATEIIKDIADETKLLSLNASIEASHAGEAGKGFAVVAEQVKNLAHQSDEASDDIENILEALEGNYQEVITSVKSLVVNMDKQSESISETHNKILVLDDNIGKVADSIEVIGKSCDEVKDLSKMVVDAFTELSSISQENSAGCQETNASIQELNAIITTVNVEANNLSGISKELVTQVDKFRV